MFSKSPEFDGNGLLPVGDYEVTFDELRALSLKIRTMLMTLMDTLCATELPWRVGNCNAT